MVAIVVVADTAIMCKSTKYYDQRKYVGGDMEINGKPSITWKQPLFVGRLNLSKKKERIVDEIHTTSYRKSLKPAFRKTIPRIVGDYIKCAEKYRKLDDY